MSWHPARANVEDRMRYAGFWRRFAAYCIDSIPIKLLVLVVCYNFFGFDAVWERYLTRKPEDIEARLEFLEARNRARDLGIALYLVYCWLAEGSAARGTLGKLIMGIEVRRADGTPLSSVDAARRNGAKLLSFFSLGLGFLWVAWSRKKQGWHDLLTGTVVVLRPADVPNPPGMRATLISDSNRQDKSG
ncbi:RDD family protein [bacterium]|nr:RDD family protein [bacterium]